jgi:hypothetical protein
MMIMSLDDLRSICDTNSREGWNWYSGEKLNDEEGFGLAMEISRVDGIGPHLQSVISQNPRTWLILIRYSIAANLWNRSFRHSIAPFPIILDPSQPRARTILKSLRTCRERKLGRYASTSPSFRR